MSNNFYSILTAVGRAKIANAHANRIPLELKQMALGDGGGTSYNPSENMTSLKNETYRRELNTLSRDPNNSNYLVAEMVIPSDVGGFYVREAALFDTSGDMIAIGKVPETYKPMLDEGAAKDLYVKFMIEVSNSEAVTLKIDPSVVLATKEMAENAALNAVKTHEERVNPHDQYLKKLDYTAQDVLTKLLTVDGATSGLDADTIDGVELAGLQPAGDYANVNHKHDLTDSKIEGILPLNKGGTGAKTAEEARKALDILQVGHAPLVPQQASWVTLGPFAPGVWFYLPQGGVWAYILVKWDVSGPFHYIWGGVGAGGSEVGRNISQTVGGVAWRIA